MTNNNENLLEKDLIKNSILLPKTNFSMRANLQSKEPEILELWDKLGLYKKIRNKSKGREKFILHYGPPYANGAIHTGHALTECLKDIVNKTKQMQGFDAPLVPGWDCHGLPIEWKVEEGIRKEGKNKEDIKITDFIKLCRDFANKWVEIQREGLKRFGICADWENPYSTMDYKSEGAIVANFLKIFMLGHVYKGHKPVLWSVVEETALAEAEVEYQNHKSTSVYVMFPVKQSNIEKLSDAYFTIWTTTPWTLPANRAIAYGDDIIYDLVSIDQVSDDCELSYLVGKKLVVANDLLTDFCKKNFIEKITAIKQFKGSDFSETVCSHPFSNSDKIRPEDRKSKFNYDFDVPLISGDHVTTEAGTGLVHTAPSHGMEDFLIGKKYNIEMPDIVKGNGEYVDDLPIFAKKHIFKVDNDVVDVLKSVELLVGQEKIEHSYPHSWRSKAPLIYRLTSQWFMRIDDVREKALSEISKVNWYPKHSINRINGMVESRPDWCLSRQRVWGVPITLFLDKETKDPLFDEEVNKKVVDVIEKEGIEAWHKYDADYFLKSDQIGKYEKVMDTLDVWFDSACTNNFVLEKREELSWPADLYLEGYDQHRGWFQSSLMQSIAINGKAPYKNVMSHGFILDSEGRKMSKSLGNVLSCDDLIKEYGADLTRLWIVSTDNSDDVRIGKEIMKRQEDVYRRFRNTIRYMLGALDGFSKDKYVDYGQLPELEKYVLALLKKMDDKHKQCISEFDFSSFYSELHVFCNNDLSAFYFDIRKDVLYCDKETGVKRMAVQTVMDILFIHIVHWLAPVLSFTAEEAWQCYYNNLNESIHERLFPNPDESWNDESLIDKWGRIRLIRKVITNAIEQERLSKAISSSLQANVVLFVEKEDAALLKDIEMDDISIISEFSILIAKPMAEAVTIEELPGVGAIVTKAEGTKCQRCWKIVKDVHGNDLCKRCFDVMNNRE